MRYLGIDYGKKRVGVSFSDESGTLAFPHSVLPCDNNLISKIKEIIQKEGVEKIILGKSLDFKGQANPIMEDINNFKTELEKETGLTVAWENETLTSAAAERGIGKDEMLDARAAALILQAYLDKHK